jgi:predicted alpha/beta-hydrolase family hydrolase
MFIASSHTLRLNSIEMSEKFTTRRLKVPVSEKLGSVTVEIYSPKKIKAVLAVGHGAGSTMDQPFLKQLCAAMASYDICTIRYNFIYSENRKKMPDRFPAASAAIRAVVGFVRQEFSRLPIFCGGKSFGGRMSSMTFAEQPDPLVKGLVFFGFPLHPSGSPSVERADHLKSLSIPLLFLQGTRDALATPALLRPIVESLDQATLIDYEGADHSFKGGKQASVAALASATAEWIHARA